MRYAAGLPARCNRSSISVQFAILSNFPVCKFSLRFGGSAAQRLGG